MPHLLIKDGNGTSQKHELSGDRITIGRLPENTIVLENESVSGRHAEIVRHAGAYIVRDIQSSNGTSVDGIPAVERVIKNGDVLAFGSVECRFLDQFKTEEPNVATFADSEGSKDPEEPHLSFGSHLADLGKATLDEAKRNAKLATLKAQIEKLKLLDLSKAHFDLGRKVYDTRALPEVFLVQYQELSFLEKSVTEGRKGVASNGDRTQSGRLKDAAVSAKMRVEAEAQNLNLKQFLTALGSEAIGHELPESCHTETEAVRKIEAQIQSLEEQVALLALDSTAKKQFGDASRSLTSATLKGLKTAATIGRRLVTRFLERKWLFRIGVVGAVFLIVVSIFFLAAFVNGAWSGMKRVGNQFFEDSASKARQQIQQRQPPLRTRLESHVSQSLDASKQVIFERFHPVGTAKALKIHEIAFKWRDGRESENENDLTAITVRYTIYWDGPIQKDGYTKIELIYDAEAERCNVKLIATSGTTKSDVKDALTEFGVSFSASFLESYMRSHNR